MNTSIVIIGAGAIGQAIARIIRDKNVKIELWDKDPSKVANQKDLRDIIPNCSIVFLCVPSWFLRDAANEIRPYISGETTVVGISKGLESGTCYRTDQVIHEIMPSQPLALLFGPMIARELQEDKHASAIIASDKQNIPYAQHIENIFNGTILSVRLHDDMASVAFAGVLKNVYTMLLGMADAVEYGINVKGQLVSTAIIEMQEIMTRLGLDPTVTLGTAGLADFIATSFSPSSTNYRVGSELALHGHTRLRSEGMVSLPSILALLKPSAESLPLLTHLQYSIDHPESIRSSLSRIIDSTESEKGV